MLRTTPPPRGSARSGTRLRLDRRWRAGAVAARPHVLVDCLDCAATPDLGVSLRLWRKILCQVAAEERPLVGREHDAEPGHALDDVLPARAGKPWSYEPAGIVATDATRRGDLAAVRGRELRGRRRRTLTPRPNRRQQRTDDSDEWRAGQTVWEAIANNNPRQLFAANAIGRFSCGRHRGLRGIIESEGVRASETEPIA
jgi:hypothetical protein